MLVSSWQCGWGGEGEWENRSQQLIPEQVSSESLSVSCIILKCALLPFSDVIALYVSDTQPAVRWAINIIYYRPHLVVCVFLSLSDMVTVSQEHEGEVSSLLSIVAIGCWCDMVHWSLSPLQTPPHILPDYMTPADAMNEHLAAQQQQAVHSCDVCTCVFLHATS